MRQNTRASRPRRTLLSALEVEQETSPSQFRPAETMPPKNTRAVLGRPAGAKQKTVSTRPMFAKRVLDVPATRARTKIRRVEMHPLSAEFGEKTVEYADELYFGAKTAIDEAHQELLATLDDTERMVLVKSMAPRLADEEVESQTVPRTKLYDRVQRFREIIDEERIKVADLGGEYKRVVKEIGVLLSKELEAEKKKEMALRKEVEALERSVEDLGREDIEELGLEHEKEKKRKRKLADFLADMG